METWIHTTMSIEWLALDTCKQLVAQGKTFVCQRVDGGWLFMVKVDK